MTRRHGPYPPPYPPCPPYPPPTPLQVPRILSPLVQAVAGIDHLVATVPGMPEYVTANFGSADGCKKAILTDFFRHAFDGSGADNYYDAGSCIDGRLTSAWNWCSKINKKPYQHILKLVGVAGFDGDFGQ